MYGLKISTCLGTENLINNAVNYAVDKGFAKKGDYVVCILSQNENTPENINLMQIIQAWWF